MSHTTGPQHVHAHRRTLGGGWARPGSICWYCVFTGCCSSVVQVSTVIWGGFPLSFSLTFASFQLSASVPQVRGGTWAELPVVIACHPLPPPQPQPYPAPTVLPGTPTSTNPRERFRQPVSMCAQMLRVSLGAPPGVPALITQCPVSPGVLLMEIIRFLCHLGSLRCRWPRKVDLHYAVVPGRTQPPAPLLMGFSPC